ncbi:MULTISPECIES: hypothetical protein [unclassified Lactobacillus]|nr:MULTISPECIES: hypothetical protein [unclassified Lactobacillus]
MRTNDIVDVFVAYTDKTGGKSRPVLMKNARKSPYFNAGMDRAKLT